MQSLPGTNAETHHNIEWMFPARRAICGGLSFEAPTDVLQLMPRLRPNDSGDHDKRDDTQRICIHPVADEVLMQHDCRYDCGQPQQKPERTQMHRANIEYRET